MTLEQEIFCPTCGEEMFTIDFDEPETIEDAGRACPNQCGWIHVEQQGEDLAVLVGVCSY